MDDRGQAWEPVVADQLQPEHVERLLKQEIAYLLIPNLLSGEWCAEITRRFLAFMAEHPDHSLQMRSSRVDTVVMAMQVYMRPDLESGPSLLDEYFARVAHDRPLLRELYAGGPDPFELIRAFWQRTGWTELAAMEDARPYHTDVLWGLMGPAAAPPHIDSYHRETPGSLARFPHRFSCNTFIQPAELGGNFRVYRHRREDGDFREDRRPSFAEYRVHPGDLLIFDAGNFHEVLSVEGSRHRLFSHMAVLLDPGSREYSIIA